MPRNKGAAKTGGRKKGTPNKRTTELLEILEEKNFCPAVALIKVYRKAMKEYERSEQVFDAVCDAREKKGMDPPLFDQGTDYLRIAESAAKGMMPFKFPKRKAVEISGKDGQAVSFTALVKALAGSEPEEEGEDD